GSGIQIRRTIARSGYENRPRQKDSRGRNGRRQGSNRSAGEAPEYGKIHLDETGAAIRFGQSSAVAGCENGANVPIERRRHSRGAAHDDLFTGILVSRNVPREDKDAV